MIQKIFITCIIITLSQVNTYSFLWEDLGVNLYKNIDEWFESLQNSSLEYEITSGANGSKEVLNKILISNNLPDCIWKDISLKNIQNISNGIKDISIINDSLKESCKSEWVNTQLISEISAVIQKGYYNIVDQVQEKNEQIHKISRVGIYADWIVENSGFDIIADLQDINSILFSEDIEYNGEEYVDLSSNVNDFFARWAQSISDDWNDEDISDGVNVSYENDDTSLDENTEETTSSDNSASNTTYHENNYICPIDQSGLSNESSNLLLSVANGSYTTSLPEDTNEPPTNSSEQVKLSDLSRSIPIRNSLWANGFTPYSNSNWWCNGFFCITIDFKTYSQNLLWWWQDISLEYLLQRSNKHLKKFASTSLDPAKLSTNNFELWLSDINLADSFHMWFQVVRKPVPITKVKTSEDNEEVTRYSKEELYKQYFNAYGLEYSKQNDILWYIKESEAARNIKTSWWQNLSEALKKWEEFNDFLEQNRQKIEIIQENVLQKVKTDQVGNFGNQFAELKVFSKSMNDYISSLQLLVDNLNDIPIYK